MIPVFVASLAHAQPNVLVVIADDLGVDKLARWQGDVAGYVPVAGDAPVTPTIDALVDDGVRFRNAWANPVCSPTRAGIMAGRHAYRTKVGSIIMIPELPTPPLALGERTLAEALDATYATGLFGKWHLGEEGRDGDGDDDPLDWETFGVRDAVPNPNRHRFEVFDGTPNGGVWDYWDWTQVVSSAYGTLSGDEHSEVIANTSYTTAETAARAADFVTTAAEPFFAVVSFHAPHTDESGYDVQHALQGCSTITSATTEREAYRAMIECLDLYLDALLADLDAAGRLDDTVIFFVGDNGTEASVADPGFPRSADGKGTPYESGVRVPFVVTEGRHLDATPYGTTYVGTPFVAGDLVAAGAVDATPVHTVDVYDTVLALAGLPETGQDSVSFAAQLADPTLPGRVVNLTERFVDMDGDGVEYGFVALRNARYKLIVWQVDDRTAIPCQRGELYDLWIDPAEATDLYDDAAYTPVRDSLRAILDASIVAYESGPGAPTHWLWALAEGPRTADSCP